MTKTVPAATALAVAMAVAAPLPAAAQTGMQQQGCCYDYNNETTNKNAIIDSFTKQINAMQLAIIEALRLGTGQTTGNMREQTTAAHNLADVQDDRRVVGDVEAARLNAIGQAASGASTCNVATSASGAALSQNVEATRAAMTQQMTNWALGAGDSPTSQGPDIAVQVRLNKHCQLYANSADALSGLCQGGGQGAMPNADVDVSQSMFYADPVTGLGTLPPQRFTAAQQFLVNSLDPNPDGPLRSSEGTTAQGRETAGRNSSNAARMSIATDTANFLLAELAPSMTTSNTSLTVGNTSAGGGGMNALQWAQQTAPNVIGYGNHSYPNGLSWYDYMDLRSRAWFQNPTWMVAMDTGSEVQAQKDATAILSFIAYQNWESYRLQMRMTMTLATMLAIQVDGVRGRQSMPTQQ